MSTSNQTAFFSGVQYSTSFPLSTKSSSQPQYVDIEIFPLGLHWFMNIFMVLTTLLGILGNGLVCHFFVKKKIKFTSFNLLLLNLSAADLMAAIFAYLHIFVDLKMLRNLPPHTANILCAFTIGISAYGVMTSVSVLTLTYISLNRFVFINYPMKTAWFKSRKNTVCFLVIVWIISIAYVVPNVFAFRFAPKYALCYREWPEIINVPLWSLTGMILYLLLPIVVMLLTLFATIHKFKKIEGGTSSNIDAMKRKKRTVKLLGFLILAFFICFAPSSIYLLFSIAFKSVWPKGAEGEFSRMKFIRVTFLICLTNTVADPVIYGYNNNEFQTCFKEALDKLRCNFGIKGKTYELSKASTSSTVEKRDALPTARSNEAYTKEERVEVV